MSSTRSRCVRRCHRRRCRAPRRHVGAQHTLVSDQAVGDGSGRGEQGTVVGGIGSGTAVPVGTPAAEQQQQREQDRQPAQQPGAQAAGDLRLSHIERPEHVAQAAEGDDAHRLALELLAQSVDIDLDGVGAGVLVQAEHLGGQLVLAHHPAGTGDQCLEHALFPGGQGQRLVGQAEAPRIQVVDQYTAALLALAAADAASQQRLDPRFQFGQLERLGQVVVGTEVEPVHAIADLTSRGEHQHRQRLAAPAQARQHLKAIQPRQPDVENRQRIVLAGQRQVGGDAVVQQVHGPAGAAQRPRHALGQLG